MFPMTKKRTTFVIKRIAEKSPIFGLFFICGVEEEMKLELMEIVGKEYNILRYIRSVFL